jgi:hypothetical protein
MTSIDKTDGAHFPTGSAFGPTRPRRWLGSLPTLPLSGAQKGGKATVKSKMSDVKTSEVVWRKGILWWKTCNRTS